MTWTVADMLLIAVIGFAGGTLGGLLGLGGSVFIIPTLTLCFGPNQHLYQASALIANVFVAGAATWRHRGRGTIRREIVPFMAAAASGAAIFGVLVSNLIPSKPLMALFGAFLCYSALAEFLAVVRRKPDAPDDPSARVSVRVSSGIGAMGGFASGLLGIGGGAIMVPLLRRVGCLPLRQAVASSAAAMIAACLIGAVAKNSSLGNLHDASGQQLALGGSLALAALLSPCAMVGGNLGAALVYKLPIDFIRAVLALLLGFAGVRMILAGLGS